MKKPKLSGTDRLLFCIMGGMQKIFIDKEHIFEVVRTGAVKVPDGAHLSARCIDGRYENSPSLPVFTFPGADAGEFLLAASAANDYGFEIDRNRVFDVLCKLVGGTAKLHFHTDEHAASPEPLKGCGHIGQMEIAPKDYGIVPEDITFSVSSTILQRPYCSL